MTISTERLQEMLAACEDYIANHVADFDDDPHADPVGEFNPYTIRAIITELVELRKGQRAVSEALTDWKPEPALSSLSNSTEPAHLAEMQLSADLPHPPTETTFVFRQAVGLQGPRAADWQDKPHRLVYDLCQIIEAEAVEKAALITELVELRKAVKPFAAGSMDVSGRAVIGVTRDDLDRLKALTEPTHD